MAGPRQQQGDGRTPPPRPRVRPLRCIIITILGIVVAVAVIVLIVFLVIRPAPLEYTVEDARVRGFNITSHNALNATFNLTIQATNRNPKISLYYDSMDISVWFDGQMLAFVENPPTFYQPRRNETTLRVDAVARGTPLLAAVAGRLKQARSAGEVELEVRLNARVRFKVGVVKTRHDRVEVDCSTVRVHFSSAAAFDRAYCDAVIRS